MTERNVHLGRNIKRLREMLGVKQDALAIELGSEWNQKKISALEAKEEIDEPLLERVSNALKIPVDVIKNFEEHAAINVISNTFHDFHNSSASGVNHSCDLTFNPLDKLIELYERMLQEKNEMIEKLEKLLQAK